MVEKADLTIPQKLPLLSGAWEGIGADRGRSFLWTVANENLQGAYSAYKKVKEDYSTGFKFRIEGGVIWCFLRHSTRKHKDPEIIQFFQFLLHKAIEQTLTYSIAQG